MKRIILDHLKRWGWLWVIIGIANGFGTGAFLGENKMDGVFTFQVVLWLGAMQLNFDLQRGISRVLTTLPLTARQIGRSWWIVSVGLPAALLIATSALGLMIHSSHTAKPFPLNLFFLNMATNTLFLGALFALFVGELPGWPQTMAGWLRRIISVGLIFAIMFSNMAYGSWTGIALLFAALYLTVFGWIRAEQMVIQRATFRPGIQSDHRGPGLHRAPDGFGGTGYLVWTTYLRSTLIGLGLMAFVMLTTYFIFHRQGHSPMGGAQLVNATMNGGLIPFVFMVLAFSLVPVTFQLRYLRTLPITPAGLSAILVLVPVLSVATVGGVVAAAAGCFAGGSVVASVANNFLMLEAKIAVVAVLVVWRGLESPTYLLVFLLIIADSFSQLGATLTYHSGTITEKIACWPSAVTFVGFTLVSMALVLGLIKTNSNVFRVRALPGNAWSFARR